MPRIPTALLDIDYEDDGPADGPVVLLLHGWPDDRGSWSKVAAALNAAGLRTIVPSLRGFAGTRFVSDATEGVGHFSQREAPAAVAERLIRHFKR